MSGTWNWAAVAILALAACNGGGMGSADLRITEESVKDCKDGTCVEATCVVTNVGISDGEGQVKVNWKGPGNDGEDLEQITLQAGQSVDIKRTFAREGKGTKSKVKISCEVL